MIGLVSCKDLMQENGSPLKISDKRSLVNILSSNTHYISNRGISNHSNPDIPYSIAWYLATYGGGTAAAPVTYFLTSDTVYNCLGRITLPAYGRISESGAQGVVQADPANWTAAGADNEFFKMNTGSILVHIELRLNWKPQRGVYIKDANDVQLIDVTIHQSKKIEQSRLISSVNSNNLTVRDCLLRRAGCDGNESNFSRRGYLIILEGGSNIMIKKNNMAISPSSGIGIHSSTNVTIDSNYINDTGRALIAGYTSDGITSYHNEASTGPINRNIWITNNTVRDSQNHGIHVSGKGFHIENNRIYNSGKNGGGSNIYLGDYKKDPVQDCSADCTIKNNIFKNVNGVDSCPMGGGASIRLEHYQPSSVVISGNTGCLTTNYTDPSCI
ncbi:right-handed parallel beta-helix repeat-containing protein [Pedobacter africanus]|uniref:Right handed beta helix region n=1 Tax=Pedobacter africanus TaxID=151894 RepID=A0A1W1Z8S5_9SPHI|nr:right-handed parallel beta-helix repeat-containing protein [Pedobacter africanus]SMC44784.1 Right handed beta helix region [Pedobacter africanus]